MGVYTSYTRWGPLLFNNYLRFGERSKKMPMKDNQIVQGSRSPSYSIILALLVCSLPMMTDAEVHKCKNPDGTVTYSDQPCPGAAKPLANPSGAPAKPDPSSPKSKKEDPVLKYDPNYRERGARCNQGDWKECKAIFETVDRIASDECDKGDKTSCSFKYCGATNIEGKAPASDFIACAKSKDYPYGRYWAISDGKPRFNTPPEQRYMSKKDIGDGFIGTNPLSMICFRESASMREMQGSLLKLHELIHVSNSAPTIFRFSLNPGRENFKPVEYQTLEALAEQHCKK